MLLFATPLWLWALAAVTALGTWALWRGRNRSRPIPSIRLWQGLTETASTRRRRVDPVWLMMFIAALLAAAALAEPAWTGHSPVDLPSARMQWSIRSLGTPASPTATEARVRLLDGIHLPEHLILAIETDADSEQQTPALPQLQRGMLLTLPPSAMRATLSLRAQNASATTPPFAQQSFVLPAIGQPFALLGAPFGDPALQRVFAIQPRARPDDPTLEHTVLLLSDPAAAPSALAALQGPALIIAAPEVPLPGLTPGDPLSTATSPPSPPPPQYLPSKMPPPPCPASSTSITYMFPPFARPRFHPNGKSSRLWPASPGSPCAGKINSP